MRTPRFRCEQSEEAVVVRISAPSIKASEVEFYIGGTEFKFFCRPYYLSLTFDNEVEETAQASAQYDISTGDLTVTLPKVTPGQYFDNLEMITKLLTPSRDRLSSLQGKSKAGNFEGIQIVGETGAAEGGGDDDDDDDGGGANNQGNEWLFPQELPESQDNGDNDIAHDLLKIVSYGFANRYSGYFDSFDADEVLDIVDLPEPESCPPDERHRLMERGDFCKFDAAHFIADYFEDDGIRDLLEWQAWWEQLSSDSVSEVVLSQDEEDVLRALPRREYILDANEEISCFLTLADILVGYCYDHRTMAGCSGEQSPESEWTISKLSASLSWLVSWKNRDVRDVAIAACRKMASFPLYRNWNLFSRVLSDCASLLCIGRKACLRALIAVKDAFARSETRYLLNRLFVDDLLVWVQSVSSARMLQFADHFKQAIATLQLHDLQWSLDSLLESAIEEVMTCNEDDAGDESSATFKCIEAFNTKKEDADESSILDIGSALDSITLEDGDKGLEQAGVSAPSPKNEALIEEIAPS